MIPIGDENPTRRFPLINYLLLAANIALFVYELSLSDSELIRFIETWGVRSNEVFALLQGDIGQLQLVLRKGLVSMFLHGGWLHIGGNMLFLWVFGDNVEDRFGSLAYLAFYLLSGYGAVIGQALLTPESPVPSIGASGAVSGVLGAYLLLYPRALVYALLPIIFLIQIRVPAWLMIFLWFGSQLLNGLASVTNTAYMNGGIAYGAHIGGFVAGLFLTALFPTSRRRSASRAPRSYRRW